MSELLYVYHIRELTGRPIPYCIQRGDNRLYGCICVLPITQTFEYICSPISFFELAQCKIRGGNSIYSMLYCIVGDTESNKTDLN